MNKAKSNETEWDLSPLLPDDSEATIEADRRKVRAANEAFANKWRARTDYLSQAKVLREALDNYEELQRRYGSEGNAGIYFWLRGQQDLLDPVVKAEQQRVLDFSNEMLELVRFFEMKIAKVPSSTAARFLKAAQLADYHHFLERLFDVAKYQLSEAEERIMDLKSDSSRQKWVHYVAETIGREQRTITLADGSQKTATYDDLSALISHNEKTVRDEAAAAINSILEVGLLPAEAELNAILADHKVNDQLRGFSRPDAARHLTDDIDSAAVDAMLEAVSSRNEVAHRLYKLKAALLGVPKLAYHERNLTFATDEGAYSFEEAAKVVSEVYTQLEPQFGRFFAEFRERHQIDVYPRKGKTGGAFCYYSTTEHPTWILLNYTDKLKDVTTLAHEFGHGLNDEYMKRAQNQLNFGSSLATAEVASQYLEDFVYDRLLAEGSDELRFSTMLAQVNDAVSSAFRQVACYRFEQSIHAEFRRTGFLSHETIGRLFQTAMEAYMGPAVDQSPGSQNWWAHWSHIRRYFYVYSYASGKLIAKSMQSRTRANRAFITKVIDFLSAGRSKSPKDTFADMGIDITDTAFWNNGIDEIEELLNETIRLARKLGKIPDETKL